MHAKRWSRLRHGVRARGRARSKFGLGEAEASSCCLQCVTHFHVSVLSRFTTLLPSACSFCYSQTSLPSFFPYIFFNFLSTKVASLPA